MRKCPKCGGRSNVIDSRENETTVTRRRKCVTCGEKWSTQEVAVCTKRGVDPRSHGRAYVAALNAMAAATRSLTRQAKRLEAEVFEKLPESVNDVDAADVRARLDGMHEETGNAASMHRKSAAADN